MATKHQTVSDSISLTTTTKVQVASLSIFPEKYRLVGLLFLQADASNSAAVLVGGTTTQALKLEAGKTLPLTNVDTAHLYVRTDTATQVVNILAVV
jgi:hypothetical protein